MKSGRDVTIYDVARVLNLSPSTVSRALKNHPHIKKETRKKVTTVANEMGYRQNKFASNLRQKHTNTIGVVLPRLDSYFMASVVSGIEKITSENEYGLIISQSQETWKKEASCISTLFNSRVDGLLVSLAFDTKNMNHFDIFFSKGIPVIFFDRVSDCSGCMSIKIDNIKAGYEATSHLIEQGCRRIIFMGGNMLRNVYNERFRGYRQALEDNNLEFDQSLHITGDMTGQSGKEAAARILRMRSRPDGLFAANDSTAVAAIVEFKNAGLRVPDDIAVVGFNNEPVSKFIEPNLTTVDYPAMEMGKMAATSLINMLNNSMHAAVSTIVLKHNLIIRGSSVRKKSK